MTSDSSSDDPAKGDLVTRDSDGNIVTVDDDDDPPAGTFVYDDNTDEFKVHDGSGSKVLFDTNTSQKQGVQGDVTIPNGNLDLSQPAQQNTFINLSGDSQTPTVKLEHLATINSHNIFTHQHRGTRLAYMCGNCGDAVYIGVPDGLLSSEGKQRLAEYAYGKFMVEDCEPGSGGQLTI